MTVHVNQRNRAVSQEAVEAITTARSFSYVPYFALPGGHNKVNGTYVPFTSLSDTGWWGSELSDSNGYLPSPAELTVDKRMYAYMFTIVGINGNFPVDFTLFLYLDNALQDSIQIKSNKKEILDIPLNNVREIDKFVLSITRISKPNDVLKVSTASFDINTSRLMKETTRNIHGRVEVTYANAVKDVVVAANDGAHASSYKNLGNNAKNPTAKFFKLYDNKLDGSYKTIGSTSERGWWPKTMPDSDGRYAVPQTLSMQFNPRNLYGFGINGDAVNGDYPVDFNVRLTDATGAVTQFSVTNNDSAAYFNDRLFRNIVGIDISVTRTSRPNRPTVIMEVPLTSAIVYEDADLINMSLLEELSYEDSVERLGGVSANELTVNFNNTDQSFYFNNPESRIAGYLKKNRRVKAWLGVEVPNGEVVWNELGTYWTHSWDVPVGSLTAKTTAFDTIGLLGTEPYVDHYVYKNISIGALIDMVLSSAKEKFSFLTWRVDQELYDIIIPYAWFEYDKYAAALNRIAACDIINIYCDRDGSIVARKRMKGVRTADDIWSDSTNLVDKSYPTLHTDLPNYLDVYITSVTEITKEVLNIENERVYAGDIRMFDFSSPVISIDKIDLVCDAAYELEWYSWGIIMTFLESGEIASLVVNARAIETDDAASIHLQNNEAIAEDGVIPCEINSDFIQTAEHATRLANYLYEKIATSMYDVEVNYRGDTSLTLNNKISLPEGIAPDNLYFIKRHELQWDGSLRGTARLNT